MLLTFLSAFSLSFILANAFLSSWDVKEFASTSTLPSLAEETKHVWSEQLHL